MIFDFIWLVLRGVVCLPLMITILLWVLLVPTKWRKYWAGWANVGSGRFGERLTYYYWRRKTWRWRLSVFSLNLGYPTYRGSERRPWEESRKAWLTANGFAQECSWIGGGE